MAGLGAGLGVADVAKELGVSVPTVRRLLKQGQLGCCKIGRRVTVPASEIERYQRAQYVPAGPSR